MFVGSVITVVTLTSDHSANSAYGLPLMPSFASMMFFRGCVINTSCMKTGTYDWLEAKTKFREFAIVECVTARLTRVREIFPESRLCESSNETL